MRGTRRMAGRGGSGPPHVTRCNDEDDFLPVGGRARLRGLCAGRRGRCRRAGRQPRDVRDDRPGHHDTSLTGADPRTFQARRRRRATWGAPRRVAAVQRIMARLQRPCRPEPTRCPNRPPYRPPSTAPKPYSASSPSRRP
ncbi:hypothetical protein EMIT0111MI5_160147 [Burkholderia sp. IT-111MI5]